MQAKLRQIALYSEHHATSVNLTLEILGLQSWAPHEVEALQKKIGATADGWFGPKSIKAYKAWARKHASDTVGANPEFEADAEASVPVTAGCVLIGDTAHRPPSGVKVVNHLEPDGAPAQKNDTGKRREPPIQFVLHRGVQVKGRNDKTLAHATERVLDAKGCSTTFTMDTDGTIYQHFDPAERYGIHCRHHNSQSDSIDFAGPFSWNITPAPGQEKITLKMAIGRENDGVPPLNRKYASVKCWTLTPEQRAAFKAFLPWYCKLRGIELTACEDWRTFRAGGLGKLDPVTNVKGIIAHTQVAGPGSRVDGILALHHLKVDGCEGLRWRKAEHFLED